MCCCLPTVLPFVVEIGVRMRVHVCSFFFVCVHVRTCVCVREIDGALVIVGLESLPRDKEETQPHS